MYYNVGMTQAKMRPENSIEALDTPLEVKVKTYLPLLWQLHQWTGQELRRASSKMLYAIVFALIIFVLASLILFP